MRVIAKSKGFFNGHLIQPGTAFEIESESVMGEWMERVAAPIPEVEVTNDDPNADVLSDDDGGDSGSDEQEPDADQVDSSDNEADELESLNQKQLRAKCQELGIAGYANLKNDEMREAIRAKTSEA